MRRWLDNHAALAAETRERSMKEFAPPEGNPPPAELRTRSFASRFDNYRRSIAAYRGRTLFIWGEKDPDYAASESDALLAQLDRPQSHCLADSGHFPMLDEPTIFTPLLKDFLED